MVGLRVPEIRKLLEGADLALYHAKVGGKNQICFFDNSMTRELVRKKEIEAELRAAIQRDELSIFFQPIVDLETGRIRTFEALVRWFHPEKGELRPDEVQRAIGTFVAEGLDGVECFYPEHSREQTWLLHDACEARGLL